MTNNYKKRMLVKIKSPWNKGKKCPQMIGNTNGFKVGGVPWNKGKSWDIKAKEKMSLAHIGKKGYWLGKERPEFSKETRYKMSEAQKGEKSHFWQGGINVINDTIRKSLKYKLWREAVFIRDKHTCQDCGQIGGELNADHIKRFADFPELRFAIDNGRTLCVPCHRKTLTYGNRSYIKNCVAVSTEA